MAQQARTTQTSGKAAGSKRKRVTAETMAAGQRNISVSEFFAKNRHLLGFDNPRKALLTTIKEAVDNALDACEEAGILPDLIVKVEHLPEIDENRFRVTVEDNGPGIVRKQVENIFGQLLYGSKFHRMKMSRGQQGIGISAAGMYGLMTTGRPMVIVTRPKKSKPAHHIELAMDTTKNRPVVSVDVETDDFSEGTGTRVTIELEARYSRGKTSVDEYLEQTAIANPHAKVTYHPPQKKAAEEPDAGALGGAPADESDGESEIISATETVVLDDRVIFPRAVDELPAETEEIRPHPYGVELGTFIQMVAKTEEKQLGGFLKREFCRVPPSVANPIYKKCNVSSGTWMSRVDHATAEKIYKALQASKLRAPPTDCLSPIGVRTMLAGMLKGVRAEFYAASTRAPAVYRGMPFQIEASIAYGGDLPGDASARVIRFANRVPLLYQQSACCSFKSVVETGWKNYQMSQPRGALPVGPLVIMIHMASVWVPFTSESKEAIADYDDIRKEMTLALKECGRKLGTYLRKRQKMRREGQRRDVFQRYIGEIAIACSEITGTDRTALYDALLTTAKRQTEIADAVLDEDGNIVRSKKKPDDGFDADDGVVIVDRDDPSGGTPSLPTPEPPSKKKAAKKKVTKKKVVKKVIKKTSKGAKKEPGASRAGATPRGKKKAPSGAKASKSPSLFD